MSQLLGWLSIVSILIISFTDVALSKQEAGVGSGSGSLWDRTTPEHPSLLSSTMNTSSGIQLKTLQGYGKLTTSSSSPEIRSRTLRKDGDDKALEVTIEFRISSFPSKGLTSYVAGQDIRELQLPVAQTSGQVMDLVDKPAQAIEPLKDQEEKLSAIITGSVVGIVFLVLVTSSIYLISAVCKRKNTRNMDPNIRIQRYGHHLLNGSPWELLRFHQARAFPYDMRGDSVNHYDIIKQRQQALLLSQIRYTSLGQRVGPDLVQSLIRDQDGIFVDNLALSPPPPTYSASTRGTNHLEVPPENSQPPSYPEIFDYDGVLPPIGPNSRPPSYVSIV